MPPVHMCVFLTHEHEELKAKIIKLKEHINQLEKVIAEKNLDHSRSCSISCQTNIVIPHRSQPIVRSTFDQEAHLHRLINSQNELLKKYENQAVNNREYRQYQISPPSEIIDDYERRLNRCQRDKEQAQQRAYSAEKHMTKIQERYENIRQKMSLLDDGFFEEVNDLKFALQQELNLGTEYEKTIQMLSARLGITYPVNES